MDYSLLVINGAIIVSNNDFKNQMVNYLIENKIMKNISYKAYEEIFKLCFGYYDDYAAVAVKKALCITDATARVYLKNSLIGKAENKKGEMLNQARIIGAPFYHHGRIKEYLGKKFYFVDPVIDERLNAVYEIFKKYSIEYEIIKTKKRNICDKRVYYFTSPHDEVFYLANEVASLLFKGVSYKNIKINTLPKNYVSIVKQVFRAFSIDIVLEEENSLYAFQGIRDFLEILKSKEELNTYDGFTEALDEAKGINEFRDQIVQVLNNYVLDLDLVKDVYEAIVLDLKAMRYQGATYNGLKTINVFDNVIGDDDYVFILGVNDGIVPCIHKDEDFFTDIEKKNSGLYTSSEMNGFESQCFFDTIFSLNNVYLSYALNYGASELQRSFVINDLEKMDSLEEKEYIPTAIYSRKYAKRILAMAMDRFFRYGEESDLLYKLRNSLELSEYRKYENKYNGTGKVLDNFSLSYTKLDDYYKCSYAYYLKYIVKIPDKSNESAEIGTFFHECLKNDFDIDGTLSSYQDEIALDEKKKYYYLKRYREILLILKDYLESFETKFTKMEKEKEYEVVLENHVLKGKIDLVRFLENRVVVLDYKTGNTKPDINFLSYGLNMQLFIYLYLLKKNGGYKFAGSYLQRILPKKFFDYNDVEENKFQSFNEQYFDYIKLDGYTNANYLESIDMNQREKSFIKGISYTVKNDLKKSSLNRVLSDKEIDSLLELTEKKIIEAMNNIADGVFTINPKLYGKKNISCEYCKFKSICFLKKDNEVSITKDDFLKSMRGGK